MNDKPLIVALAPKNSAAEMFLKELNKNPRIRALRRNSYPSLNRLLKSNPEPMIFVIDLETHLDDLEKIADIFERVFPGTFLVALTYDHNDFEFLNYLDNLHFNLILNPEHDLAYEITYNFAVHCWQSKI